MYAPPHNHLPLLPGGSSQCLPRQQCVVPAEGGGLFVHRTRPSEWPPPGEGLDGQSHYVQRTGVIRETGMSLNVFLTN